MVSPRNANNRTIVPARREGTVMYGTAKHSDCSWLYVCLLVWALFDVEEVVGSAL